MATIDPLTGLPTSNTQIVYPGDRPVNPTVPTPVATSAPKVTVPVASSTTASSLINEKIVPTMNTAQTQLTAAQQAQLAQQTSGTAKPFSEYAVNNVPETKPAMTAEQEIASQPDAGHQWIYNKATGEKTQIPIGQAIPSNYTGVDVKNAPPVETTFSSDGNITFKKLADGSYGQYDTRTGQYVGQSNETQFNLMKTGQANAKAYQDAIINGPLLNESQKAQIKSIQDTYQRLLDQQAKANANFTGGTTVAQNLYGVGNTGIGLGAIKTSIDEGVSKIADLTSRMNSDVSKMTAAFQSDDLAVLKGAYDSFVNNSKSLQDAIDKQHTEAVQLERDSKQQAATARQQVDNDIRALIDTATKAQAPAEVINAMQKAAESGDFSGAAKAGGQYLATGTGVVGEYYADRRDFEQRNPGAQFMSMEEYFQKDANRKASIARAGAAIAAGTDMTTKQQSVFNSIADHQNKSPLIMAADRATILKKITDEVSKDPSNAALQVSFIYSMIQALDTYQSAVREGEINLISGTQGLGEKLQNVPSKIEKGNPLNPTKIAEYVNVSKTLTNSIDAAAQAKKNTFKAQAISNGIGKQWQEYANTVNELNSTSIVDEHAENTKNDPLNLGTKILGGNSNPLGI